MTTPGATRRWQQLWICALLLLADALTYWPVTGCGFINLDDTQYVSRNPAVMGGLSWTGIQWAFTHAYSANWHPLTWISHMADVQLYGLNPLGHHLTNVLLHALNGVLLFLVLESMTGALWRSAFVAALFGLHPMHVESVAWVAERKDVLSTCFGLCCLWAYTKYARARSQSPRPKTRAYYALALVCYAGSLLSKPMLVSWPLVLLLVDFWPLHRFGGESGAQATAGTRDPASAVRIERGTSGFKLGVVVRLVWEKVPFFGLSLGSCLATIWAQASSHAVVPLTALPLAARLLVALNAYVRYLWKLLWPVDLAVIYPFFGNSLVLGLAVAVPVLAGVTSLVVWQRRARPYLLVGWLWYLVMLVPVIGLVQVGSQSMADRYTYLPAVGLFFALTWAISDAARTRTIRITLAAASALVLVACGLGSLRQLAYWRDTETLLRHALAVTSRNFVAWHNLGICLCDLGRLEEGAECFQEAADLNPLFQPAWHALGCARLQQQKFAEAIPDFETVLRIDPNFAEAHSSLALALARSGQPEAALEEYRRALAIDPSLSAARFAAAGLLVDLGKLPEAVAELQAVLRSDPESAEAHFRLANILSRQGEQGQAVEHYRAGLLRAKDAPEPLNNLAWILATSIHPELRNGAEAVELAERACKLTDYQVPVLVGTLAAAYAEADRFAAAAAMARKARELALQAQDPDLAAKNAQLLELYRAGKPYHETR